MLAPESRVIPGVSSFITAISSNHGVSPSNVGETICISTVISGSKVWPEAVAIAWYPSRASLWRVESKLRATRSDKKTVRRVLPVSLETRNGRVKLGSPPHYRGSLIRA